MTDYKKINIAIGKALSDYGDSVFPINVYLAIMKIPDIALMTYKEIIDSFLPFNSESEIINKLTLSKDGALLKVEGIKGFLLAYKDDSSIPYTRIRWTLAHELGHYYLKHLRDEITLMSRGGLSDLKYDNKEKEANLFARDFLVNPAAIFDPAEYKIKAKKIEQVFEVSKEASRNISNNLRRRPWLISHWRSWLKIDNPVFNKIIDYSGYIPTYGDDIFELILQEKILYFNYCYNCHALNSGRDPKITFCSVCHSENILITTHNFKFHENEEQNVFEYDKYPVEGNPAKIQDECAVCGNAITDNVNFCDVCGTYLINRCTGISFDDISYNKQFDDWNVFDNSQILPTDNKEMLSGFENGCDYPQSGKARFCGKCGSVTTFYLLHYFDDWKKEKQSLGISQEELPW